MNCLNCSCRGKINKLKNGAHKRALFLFIIFVNIFLINSFCFSEQETHDDYVEIKTSISADSIKAGGETKILIRAIIENGWHINSNKPNDEYLIPTKLEIKSDQDIQLVNVKYPVAKNLKFDFSDKPVSVFEKEITIEGTLKVSKNVPVGKYNLKIVLNYQACNNSTCMPPNTAEEKVSLKVIGQSLVNTIQNDTSIVSKNEKAATINNTSTENQNEESSLQSKLASSSLLVSLIIVFLGGLALNLTPCVYPLIPITVGYFGGQSEGSTGKLFLLGLLYVLGLAITYSIVGVITALSGAVFGTLLQNPIVILGITIVLVALSLSMFGVYEFKLPDSWVMKAGGAKAGYAGAIFMGLTMGIVAAPCIGPFVLGLVTFIGAKGDPYYGFLMFFFLALGLGTPYIFLALFSGKIKSIPKAGFWMDAVKHIFGFVLLGMAIYFLLPLLPQNIAGYVLPIYMILASLYIFVFDKSANKVKGFKYFKNVVSVLIIAVAIYMLIPSEKKAPDWKTYSEDIYKKSLSNNQPMVIDFYADWCIPCKELDAVTYADMNVISECNRFNMFKIDMTKSLSSETELIRKKFNIVGMPTVIFIDSKGIEVKRITGFVKADKFLSILKTVR